MMAHIPGIPSRIITSQPLIMRTFCLQKAKLLVSDGTTSLSKRMKDMLLNIIPEKESVFQSDHIYTLRIIKMYIEKHLEKLISNSISYLHNKKNIEKKSYWAFDKLNFETSNEKLPVRIAVGSSILDLQSGSGLEIKRDTAAVKIIFLFPGSGHL